MPDLLKAAERLAKTARTGFWAFLDGVEFVGESLRLAFGLPALFDSAVSPAVFPGGFACLAPPFECLGCVTTSDCTWPREQVQSEITEEMQADIDEGIRCKVWPLIRLHLPPRFRSVFLPERCGRTQK